FLAFGQLAKVWGALDLPNSPTLINWQKKTKRICGLDAQGLQVYRQQHAIKAYSPRAMMKLCWKATWSLALLARGFGFPLDSQQISFAVPAPPNPSLRLRIDPKGDPKLDPKGDPKHDPRGDPKHDPIGDPKHDPRGDHRGDPGGDPALDPGVDSRVDPEDDPEDDPDRSLETGWALGSMIVDVNRYPVIVPEKEGPLTFFAAALAFFSTSFSAFLFYFINKFKQQFKTLQEGPLFSSSI
ncbi:ectonucleoside triphosphate diphosphohydrolase, putative, partial [Eimeria tenella]